jgi:PAS domain S-box-containing protein
MALNQTVETTFQIKNGLRILHLEDSRRDAELTRATLEGEGLVCQIVHVKNREEFESAVVQERFDVILSDYSLPDYNGFSALDFVRGKVPDVPFILLSGTVGEEVAVESLKTGATDYILKERLQRLVPAVSRALHEKEERAKRKRAEQALEATRRHNELILHSTGEGICGLDLEGKATFINRAAAEKLGYPPEELIGKALHALVHHTKPDGSSYAEHESPIYDAYKRGTAHHAESEVFWRKDGTSFPAEYVSNPIHNERGDLVGAVVTFRDITERKQAEEEKSNLQEQLRQVQKLEAIGTLAGGIAHDFNNILGAMIGYTELAKEDMPAEQRGSKQLEEVLKAGQRAKELVQQILAFSRQSVPERKPVAIGMIVREALKLLRATLPSTIQIRTEIKTKCDRIIADPVQIHQILMNLCTNAAHAMREKGGTLTVSLREITESLATTSTGQMPGPHVRLTVSDTGHGMAKAVMDRIFDPFFTTKPVGEGTGLGLSVVHGIVTSHGGRISVSSEQGVGTTFELVFPQTTESVRVAQDIGVPSAGGDERILLVDDEEPLANLLRERLERYGYKVVSEVDSAAAFERFCAAPSDFQVVITDQTMPGLTGVELAKRIRQIRPEIPVFICTGYSESVNKEDLKTLPLCEIVLKPVDMRALNAAMRRHLDEKRDIAC